MGKRRFAATISSPEHKTDSHKYASNLVAWIRGWHYGVEVVAGDFEGKDCFDIWIAGGSNARSNGRRMIGRVIDGEFRKAN
jgi:hypothetical protein